MRRTIALSLACAACLTLPAARTGEVAEGNPYYCPPGAKFCPVPGTDNTVFLDTHFGMDAQTGVVKAYTGTIHPDEAPNGPMTGEELLFTAPPISVENRYVPRPGTSASEVALATSARGAAPTQAPRVQTAVYDPAATTGPVTRRAAAPHRDEPRSEVANQSLRNERPVTNGNRVPWWKGGVWRNRRGGGGDGRVPPPAAGRSPDPEDMWEDDEDDYSAYSAGRPSAGDPYGAGQYDSWNQPASDPWGQSAPDPWSAPGTANYAGSPYTLPDSPPPSSPYQPGYVYPGTDLSYESTGQGGYGQPQYIIGPPQEVPSPYSQTAVQAAAPEAGSPQFENAVRMVRENRFSDAKNLLASETSRNPTNAAAWRWLGDCHYNLLELNDAVGCYQRALDVEPNDYYALRGQGFAFLHRGHEYWRRMQEEVSRGQRDQAAATFAQAHEDYKRSLDLLGLCLRRAPNDGEAVYGEAMAAEGASRKLYSNAVSYLKLGPEQRGRAELFAENCLTVINKGIERARERARDSSSDAGPRALLAGLYLRKAILYHQLGKDELALVEVRNSRDVQQSILDEIDPNNATALRGVKECEGYWEEWGSRL
ncbi:MAG: tetratricopeptide repeat protein [Planctomycetes bacterium]|nr:tetratricopeptide repeat protein [Planctomycetota bacterium]